MLKLRCSWYRTWIDFFHSCTNSYLSDFHASIKILLSFLGTLRWFESMFRVTPQRQRIKARNPSSRAAQIPALLGPFTDLFFVLYALHLQIWSLFKGVVTPVKHPLLLSGLARLHSWVWVQLLVRVSLADSQVMRFSMCPSPLVSCSLVSAWDHNHTRKFGVGRSFSRCMSHWALWIWGQILWRDTLLYQSELCQKTPFCFCGHER